MAGQASRRRAAAQTSKRRLAHLINARASVAHFKKQKLEQAHGLNMKQPNINDNGLSTSDTGDTDADTDKEIVDG